MSQRFLTTLLLFLGIYLFLSTFLIPERSVDAPQEDFSLELSSGSFAPGDDIILTVTNNLDRTYDVPTNCPSNPLTVERYSNGQWELLVDSEADYYDCAVTSDGLPSPFSFEPLKPVEISFAPWKADLFTELGRYRLTLDLLVEGTQKSFFTEFEVVERGFFSSVGYQLFYRPIFNLLVFLTSVSPGHNFGLAVIALTLIIRLLLLVPSQKALKAQQAMMSIQPELEILRKKYAKDQEKLTRETMALWQKHKVNPVGGCLPLLVQIPIMIALFYAVQNGFTVYDSHVLYHYLADIDLSLVDQNFYGLLDLQQVNATWLPVLVGLLQFVQMKLSFAKRKVSLDDSKVLDLSEDGTVKSDSTPPDPMKIMNKTMMYFMPVMIAVLTATLPAAVGLYLFVTTLFGVVQQYFVRVPHSSAH